MLKVLTIWMRIAIYHLTIQMLGFYSKTRHDTILCGSNGVRDGKIHGFYFDNLIEMVKID